MTDIPEALSDAMAETVAGYMRDIRMTYQLGIRMAEINSLFQQETGHSFTRYYFGDQSDCIAYLDSGTRNLLQLTFGLNGYATGTFPTLNQRRMWYHPGNTPTLQITWNDPTPRITQVNATSQMDALKHMCQMFKTCHD